MADLSHELGALRFVVDSPLSSKVAMFNKQVAQHSNAQLLNPFSQTDGRASPKPDITKDDYGKPLAGSLTEMRGQKANMHVMREMLELCQIIDSEGYDVKDEASMRVITFGELFNIYNYISDKCVGILLRARKHKLVDFEGEMLFQRRDDDVPIFLLKPIVEIRRELNDKIECIKRAGSPAPQATSVLLDKKANGLSVPKSRGASRTPSPQSSKSNSPVKETKPAAPAAVVNAAPSSSPPASTPTTPAPNTPSLENPKIQLSGEREKSVNAEEPKQNEQPPTQAATVDTKAAEATTLEIKAAEAAITEIKAAEAATLEIKAAEAATPDIKAAEITPIEVKAETEPQPQLTAVATAENQQPAEIIENQPKVEEQQTTTPPPPAETNADDLPTVVIEATAVYRRGSAAAETSANPAA